MRLSDKYAPKCLDEVVGQGPIIRRMQAFVEEPEPAKWLFQGQPGTGKTATANALAADLGCCPWTGRIVVGAARLGVERIEELFDKGLWYRPMGGCPWKVLIVEELERCVSDGARSELKARLSENELPPHTILVATSNDTSKLEAALLERFDPLIFDHGEAFPYLREGTIDREKADGAYGTPRCWRNATLGCSALEPSDAAPGASRERRVSRHPGWLCQS